MDTKVTSMWWLKNHKLDTNINNKSAPEEEITTSLAEFLETEKELYLDELNKNDEDVDIDSILEEITQLSAKSPLVPYEQNNKERSFEDIMKEVEKIYVESSKSFEQLSQRSKTSQNISDMLNSDNSTPTPKSLSPLPLDDDKKLSDNDDSSSTSSEEDIHKSLIASENVATPIAEPRYSTDFDSGESKDSQNDTKNKIENASNSSEDIHMTNGGIIDVQLHEDNKALINEEMVKKDEVIKMLLGDNKELKEEIKQLENQIDDLRQLLEQQAKTALAFKSPETDLELRQSREALKDMKELNTALQLQLDSTNKSHQSLKVLYDDLMNSNKQLERRTLDVDNLLSRYKQELLNSQQKNDKLIEHEASVNKQLEAERQQVRGLKQQIEKDSKCIMDLNRQIKEMERIIARKHPDSVSALIVAARNEDNSPTARKILEDRIRSLEQDALMRDAQNSKVFIDVQDKFNQMKLKYESHIEDLELHVNDLKTQLKQRKIDTYDVYTQTMRGDQKIPAKETKNAACQVTIRTQIQAPQPNKKPDNKEVKEDTHLLATIRGFQADLSNKEKVIVKLQKEIDELRKTNRRLQKEREGSLKNLSEKKEFRSYPDKLSAQADETFTSKNFNEELRAVKLERDKMKVQLCRIEEDYQALKAKRLQDLNTLQEAHEREISTYLANITPLREQLEVQQVSLTTIQQQLVAAKEELAVVTVERDHLNNKLNCGIQILPEALNGNDDCNEVVSLRKKISLLEMKYEEREHRLRAIVHGLAQKSVTNRSCEQCAARQQQLIGYKAELDQLIATLRSLQ